jgi:hypothetical protein
MPSVIDPKVARATVALKRSQTRLTNLRRQHLQGDYLARAVVQDFVVGLAYEFRQKVLELPPRLRQVLPGKPDFETQDRFEEVVDEFLREVAETDLTVPAAERFKSAYCSRPGPKKRVNNGAGEKALERPAE